MDGEAGNQQKAEQEGGVLDRRYYRGLLAIPKGVEVVSAMTRCFRSGEMDKFSFKSTRSYHNTGIKYRYL